MQFQKCSLHILRNKELGRHSVIERSKIKAYINTRNELKPISMVKQEPSKIANRVGAIASTVAQTYMAIVLIEYSTLAFQ